MRRHPAGLMLFLALGGLWIVFVGAHIDFFKEFGKGGFSTLYDMLGLGLLFCTRAPGQRITIGPISFSLDPVPKDTPLDYDPDALVAPPDGFQFEDNGLERRISWRWISWYSMRGIVFAVLLGIPFEFVLYICLHSPTDAPWPLLYGLGTVPGAIVYMWLCYLVNRTTVRIDAMGVVVRHGPLPWLGAKDVLKADIASVMSEQYRASWNNSSDGTMFEPNYTYLVKLLLKDGKKRNLVTGLLAPEQAIFIEQQIRRA